MQAQRVEVTASSTPPQDDRLVRPLTETDQVLMDARPRALQLAAVWINVPSMEMAH